MFVLTACRKISPTRRNIVAVSLLLTIIAQAVLAWIGYSYVSSMNRIVEEKRMNTIIEQFYQNTLLQVGEVNNLLQLLQSPDFSDFFQGEMNVRDAQTVEAQKAVLQNKMNGLRLSPSLVNKVYMIGADSNQKSFVKESGKPSLEELTFIRMDMLEQCGLSRKFLEDNNRFAKYTADELSMPQTSQGKTASEEGDMELNWFVDDLQNKLILSNGNINGVLIIIVLNDQFFETALPAVLSSSSNFMIQGERGETIWASGTIGSKDDHSFAERHKELNPYPYRIVYTQTGGRDGELVHSVVLQFIIVAGVTIFFTFMISYFYSKRLFYPYVMLSKKMTSRSEATDLQAKLISDDWLGKGIDLLSMRNKLILIFSLSVIIPTISDELLYSQAANKLVKKQVDEIVQESGSFANVSFQIRMDAMTNLINQLSVSEQLQEYLIQRNDFSVYKPPSKSATFSVKLSMFPGLNEVSYFVLFDLAGQSLYSSVFSNTPDIFTIDSDLLKNSEDPYWISGYNDVFNNTTPAVLKRVHIDFGANATANYLMLVPRTSFFENIGSAESVRITDERGKEIYAFDAFPGQLVDHSSVWNGTVPGTDWRFSIQYSFKEIDSQNRQYDYYFLFIVALMFLLSFSISFILSFFLVRPLNQLKITMSQAELGDLPSVVPYNGTSEIGGIIRSYNEMIMRMDAMIRENTRIMEENANNKVKENELVSMKVQAELKMLQAQINPHFLYNTLEAINMRSIKSGNEEISLIVSSLAQLFRYSINGGTGTVALEKELSHVQNYVSIHRIRFGENLDFELDIPDSLKGIQVVRFILQPIVENALKHGFPGAMQGGLIRICASEQEGWARLVITDNGIGMDEETLVKLTEELRGDPDRKTGAEEKTDGIGLSNVYHRLWLHYKAQVAMEIESRPMQGTKVSIRFPLSW